MILNKADISGLEYTIFYQRHQRNYHWSIMRSSKVLTPQLLYNYLPANPKEYHQEHNEIKPNYNILAKKLMIQYQIQNITKKQELLVQLTDGSVGHEQPH